jgi:Uma2 family endonuclease
VVIEVLSTSTQDVDQLFKLEEYQAIAGLEAIIFIAPTIPQVGVWSRDSAASWRRVKLLDQTASIELPGLGVSLPLSEIYERVVFQEVTGPRLVWPDPA